MIVLAGCFLLSCIAIVFVRRAVHHVKLNQSAELYGNPINCLHYPRHLPVVVYAGIWKVQFYVKCWSCDLNLGPFPTQVIAMQAAKLIQQEEGSLNGG